ncbi:MAG: hypothetical protein Q7K42_04760, partial [Candidatus Diapherotrites archaeon]|nr:hypothetical protein [Candidatus Diapherotrites archaeon]
AMHEAMEQGRVSVAKAGIIASFKTDTTILAAANPKYSRFDPYQPYLEQIDLPPTLLSRFDLFFPMKDVLDRIKDTEIAGHILSTHQLGEAILQQQITGKKTFTITTEQAKIMAPVIDLDILKKYIAFARQKIFPIMEKETIQAISDFYINLREQGRKEGSFAATHRQLEGIVRLSEASARVRLSDAVEIQDVQRAVRLVKASFEELLTDPETGKIDIDILTSGSTHTQLSQMKTVLRIIKSLAEEEDIVSLDKIIEQAKTEGIDMDKAQEAISKLKKKGDIYEPRHKFLKPTQKN